MAVAPASVIPRIVPAAVPASIPATVPSAIVPRIPVPRVVPSAVIVPRIRAPVDGGVERTVPGIPGCRVPRLVGGPGVETVVVEVNGCGVVSVVEIYSRRFVLRDEQSVNLLSALHEDRGVLCLCHKKVGLLVICGGGCLLGLMDLGIGCIVDSILILLPGSITGKPRR